MRHFAHVVGHGGVRLWGLSADERFRRHFAESKPPADAPGLAGREPDPVAAALRTAHGSP